MLGKADVKSSYEAGEAYKDALKKIDEKPTGYHPYHLGVAAQKAKKIRDIKVSELRSSFKFLKGGRYNEPEDQE